LDGMLCPLYQASIGPTLYDKDSISYPNVGIRLLVNTVSYSRRTEATIWIPIGLTVHVSVDSIACISEIIPKFKAKNGVAFETSTVGPPATRYYPETG